MMKPSTSNAALGLENQRMELCKQIFRKTVESVLPRNLIRNQVIRNGASLRINQKHVIDLQALSGIQIVGFGKAVLPMAEELVQVLDRNQLRRCVLSVPLGTRPTVDPIIEMHCGAKNNIPDDDALKATVKITEVVSMALPSDLVIVLISGGGSALLPFPRPPLTLREKSDLIRALSRAGADITDLNTVRRALSLVKGGGLLNFCKSDQVVSLILSDVLGDDLDIIASGPTVPASEKPSSISPLEVIKKYALPSSAVSANVYSMLNQSRKHYEKHSPSSVQNLIIGNNKLALNTASIAARDAGYYPVIATSELQGDARVVGSKIAEICCAVAQTLHQQMPTTRSNSTLTTLLNDIGIPPEVQTDLMTEIRYLVENQRRFEGLCLLFGGETTVKVTGSGIGGRNQELALSAAIKLQQMQNDAHIVIGSGGTDGIDGPCDAAGAIVTGNTIAAGLNSGFDPSGFLENNDSYSYFKGISNGKFHLVTGHTETNVMDIVICLIPNAEVQCTRLHNSNL